MKRIFAFKSIAAHIGICLRLRILSIYEKNICGVRYACFFGQTLLSYGFAHGLRLLSDFVSSNFLRKSVVLFVWCSVLQYCLQRAYETRRYILFILAKHAVSLRHCCFTYMLSSFANCVAADDVSKLILSHSLREIRCVCALFICTIRIAHTKCEPIDKGETVNTSNENISAISTLDSIQSSTTTIFPTRKLFRRHKIHLYKISHSVRHSSVS